MKASKTIYAYEQAVIAGWNFSLAKQYAVSKKNPGKFSTIHKMDNH